MSGHSKWSTIKHKKAATDAKRGKIFTKLIRAITVAAKTGGGDPDANPPLRLAIDKAKAQNLPNDKIDKAISRGTGEIEGATYETLTYEGYAPGGIAVIAEVMTDNRNRTVAEIRNIFAKANGNLGQDGCVSWMFDLLGQIIVEGEQIDEDDLMMAALEGGAEDVVREGDAFVVTCQPQQFDELKRSLVDAGFSDFVQAEVTQVPKSTIKVMGPEAEQVIRLVEALEDQDDVQTVHANFDIPDDELEALGA